MPLLQENQHDVWIREGAVPPAPHTDIFNQFMPRSISVCVDLARFKRPALCSRTSAAKTITSLRANALDSFKPVKYLKPVSRFANAPLSLSDSVFLFCRFVLACINFSDYYVFIGD